MAFDGNYIYIAETGSHKISKFDINQINPIAIDVKGLNRPVLTIKNSELFIVESRGNKISKINLTESSPVLTDVITDLNDPSEKFF